MTGASEFFDLAKDFTAAGPKVATALYTAFKAGGDEFADDWRTFATETAGAHAHEYPETITSETQVALGIHVTTGPEARGQGMLGRVLEFGGLHSSAHLDGLRALPIAERRLEKSSGEAVEQALP
jgi:hypothetical protein